MRLHHFGWSWTPREGSQMATGDFRVLIGPWWIRLIYGVTFKPDRFRYRRFGDGHRLLAVRCGELSHRDGRLLGVQWQLRRDRGRRIDNGREVPA